MILTGTQIKDYQPPIFEPCFDADRYINIFNPKSEEDKEFKVPGYGVTYAGYDLRVGDDWIIHTHRAALQFALEHGNDTDEAYIISDLERLDYNKRANFDIEWWKINKELSATGPDDVIALKVKKQHPILMPGQMILGVSLEYIRIPTHLIAFCSCKSSLVRKGLNVPPTIFEPGWEGDLTLEILNVMPHPQRVYTGQGIAQVNLHHIDGVAQYMGLYQAQTGVTKSRA